MIYLIQAISIVFTLAVIWAEWAFTWPFREVFFYPDNLALDVSTKKKLSLIFHRFGAIAIIVLSLGFGATAFIVLHDRSFFFKLGHFFSWGFIFGGTFWLIFDIGYALKINQDWYYLGKTAEEDTWLNNAFGKYAGALKAVVLIGLIIFMNIIN